MRSQDLPAQQANASNLDLNLLRTFRVIAEERSLTKAAERLAIKQPSVSAALQRLEEAVGCMLVVRASRRFELTRHGELLFQECADIHQKVSRIYDKLAGASRDLTGTVRVILVTDVRYPPLDAALRLMHQRHPSVSIQIDLANSQEGSRAVAQKTAPLAFCLLSQPIAGLNCQHLMREEFALFCGAGHPLYGQNCSLDKLRDQPFVSFGCAVSGGTLEPMLALGANVGFGRRLAGASAHLREVRRMVLAGLGIGLLPVDSVRRDVAEGKLWRLNSQDVELGANLYLVTNPAMPLETAEVRFLEILQESMALAGAPSPDAGFLSPLQ